MAHLPNVLICDDESLFHFAVKENLKGRYHCLSAFDGDQALEILKAQRIQVLLLDIKMRTAREGLTYLPRFLEADPDLSVIICSQFRDFAVAREAMVSGAVDYLPKDSEPGEFVFSVERAIERQGLVKRTNQQNMEAIKLQKQFSLIGQSAWAVSLRTKIEKIRRGLGNVVITGETGTGKELVARQLRKTLPDGTLEPFIAVDSSTIQSSTAESSLFGYERGAFTGADRVSKGLFEAADGGVIYFDEIANMPLEIQAKLLRVIQEKEIRRLGSNKTISLNFRVVCATNKDLGELCEMGLFKDDLYQRLNVLPLRILPLRERTEEIPLLLDHFSHQYPSAAGVLKFNDETLQILMAYSWPGNVRELGNLVCLLATLSESALVRPCDLPEQFFSKTRKTSLDQALKGAYTVEDFETETEEGYYDCVRNFEKTLLEKKYRILGGNIMEMSRKLQMDRSHLYSKLKDFNIHSVEKKSKTVR
ncbi:MAG: sigma-54-dependent Fis family transcriptional regulator [Bdellovibrio sp.]|nr:sigma-54-dependent Fis family transcriptional regulator [Bdellovibrio sp.]